jgi:hypothetical protein
MGVEQYMLRKRMAGEKKYARDSTYQRKNEYRAG